MDVRAELCRLLKSSETESVSEGEFEGQYYSYARNDMSYRIAGNFQEASFRG